MVNENNQSGEGDMAAAWRMAAYQRHQKKTQNGVKSSGGGGINVGGGIIEAARQYGGVGVSGIGGRSARK